MCSMADIAAEVHRGVGLAVDLAAQSVTYHRPGVADVVINARFTEDEGAEERGDRGGISAVRRARLAISTDATNGITDASSADSVTVGGEKWNVGGPPQNTAGGQMLNLVLHVVESRTPSTHINQGGV